MPDLDEWLKLYASGNPTVKLRAARALLRRPQESPLETLLDILDRLAHDGLGAAVWRALGDRRDPELLDEMVARLATPDSLVRALACHVLGRTGKPQAAAHLARMIDDAELSVRQSAISALATLDDPAAIAVLERRLSESTDDDETTVKAMEQALWWLRNSKAKDG